jgi:hypothetical protein
LDVGEKPHNYPTMKRVWNILFFVFFIFCLFLFKPREDVVFAALNKSQCIRLFEKGNDFELCVEENMRYTGTYTISEDTIFLLYQDHMDLSNKNRDNQPPDFSKILPLKLFINNDASNITASDGLSFSAEIYLDIRHRSHELAPNKIRFRNNQRAIISAIGSP